MRPSSRQIAIWTAVLAAAVGARFGLEGAQPQASVAAPISVAEAPGVKARIDRAAPAPPTSAAPRLEMARYLAPDGMASLLNRDRAQPVLLTNIPEGMPTMSAGPVRGGVSWRAEPALPLPRR